MEDVAFVSLLGTAGMLGAVVVIIGRLLVLALDPSTPRAHTELVARGRGLQVGHSVQHMLCVVYALCCVLCAVYSW